MKIQIIIGSTRPNRFSEKPARWLFDLAKGRTDFEVELLDLRDYPLPFFDEAMPPRALKGVHSNEVAKRWAAKVGEGDGYIIVTPEYNHGYPAVLKNALDTTYFEWNGKPVAFVSYGGAMGVRSVEQFRQVAVELQMYSIELGLQVPVQTFRDALKAKDSELAALFEPLKPFANDLLNEIGRWAAKLKSVR